MNIVSHLMHKVADFMTFCQFSFKLCISLLVLEIREHYLQFSACRRPSKLTLICQQNNIKTNKHRQTDKHVFIVFLMHFQNSSNQKRVLSLWKAVSVKGLKFCLYTINSNGSKHEFILRQDQRTDHPYFFLSFADICLFLSILVPCTLQRSNDCYILFHFKILEDIRYYYCHQNQNDRPGQRKLLVQYTQQRLNFWRQGGLKCNMQSGGSSVEGFLFRKKT